MSSSRKYTECRWGGILGGMRTRLALLWLAVVFTACSGTGALREPDYFPGNSPYYSFGVAQSKENFVNVRRAQSAIGLYANDRAWGDSGPGIAPGTVSMVQTYFPFSMRWELKDGRQFILENIDVRSIMKEYFKDKSNDITLPWQREGRQRDRWDYDPALVYEVKDDTVRLKWLITDIKTPPSQRFLPSGATTKWDLDRKEYLVKEIKGKPTQGIDFDQKWEFRKSINRGAVNGK
jgi:hypothetical protein